MTSAGAARPDYVGLSPDEARLRLAQEAGGVGLWEWQPGTGVVVWDQACADMFDVPLQAFEGTLEGFAARTHPDDVPVVEERLRAAVDTAGPFIAHFRALLPGGGVRHLLSRGHAVPDEGGVVDRVLGAVVDVSELHAAIEDRTHAAQSIARLADVALELATVRTLDDLVRVVIGVGLAVLGADGGAVCVRDDARQVVRLSVSESLPDRIAVEFAELPLDGPLPGSWVALHGEAVLLPTRADGLAFSPAMQIVYDGTDRDAWATLPLRAGGRLLGSLVVSWAHERSFDGPTRELLNAFAAQCAQALDRVQVLDAERAAVEDALRMSEALQRSLLSPPPQPDHLHIAVRYAPAAQLAQVGGDWYDAFLTPDGSTHLVIGDVTGHDRTAAASMGAVRNLLRGTAYALPGSPAAVLTALELAMSGLDVDTLATAVLARIEQTPEQKATGVRVLRWSNAGHLPPLLLHADGSAELLTTSADLLLGLLPDVGRTDHTRELQPSDTLLLYTDGLVERRGEDLDAAVERLRATTERLAPAHADLEPLCDALLAALLPPEKEDDVAIVAVRLHPQDAPRPAEAGPEVVPQGAALGLALRVGAAALGG